MNRVIETGMYPGLEVNSAIETGVLAVVNAGRGGEERRREVPFQPLKAKLHCQTTLNLED